MEQLRLEAIINAHRQEPGALLPILHEIQAETGHIPVSAIPAIASALRLSRAEVHGVISFYADFRTEPAGKHTLQICRAEACQARGSAALVAHAQSTLGIADHQTTADGNITLEPVYCLGLCACSPSVRVGDTLLGRMDVTQLDALLNTLRQGETSHE